MIRLEVALLDVDTVSGVINRSEVLESVDAQRMHIALRSRTIAAHWYTNDRFSKLQTTAIVLCLGLNNDW